MERLLNGTVGFRNSDFQTYKDIFKELGDKRNPHTLFIGCSDSRVDPRMITNTFPGEILVIRNIANILEQIKHLFSYPFIKEKFQLGKLKIYGWHYIIETGEVLCYNKDKGYFELIN